MFKYLSFMCLYSVVLQSQTYLHSAVSAQEKDLATTPYSFGYREKRLWLVCISFNPSQDVGVNLFCMWGGEPRHRNG